MKNLFKYFKKMFPKTLFGRSLLILITPVFLIQIVASFTFFDSHWNKVTSRLAYAVAGEIGLLVQVVKADNDARMIDHSFSLAQHNLSLLVTFEENKKMQDFSNTYGGKVMWDSMIAETLRRELEKIITEPFAIHVDFQEKWIEVRVQLENGVLNVSLPQRRLFSSSSYVFLLWVFCASFVLLIISVFFMRNQIRPIRRLAIAAERFGKGRDVDNFKIEGAKEVRQAGKAFWDMKQRIQRQISQRTEMLAGVSHDLRTPLTRLKLELAMLPESADTIAMKQDILEMERMIEGYLNFVRGDGDENTEQTDFVILLEDVIANARRQGAQISFECALENLFMPLKPLAMRRCLMNVLSNAGKYADHIWVTLSTHGENTVRIVIEDNGVGIPEDQYEAVFRPFYRVDSSRNTDTGGVGLGLPIAMDIVHAHGGEISLGRSKHGGLAVTIDLPL